MIYSICGLNVELKFRYNYGIKKCQKYSSKGTPVFSAEASEKEIEEEAALIPGNSLEVAEFDCVFRKLYKAMPKFGRILIHGAALQIDGKGFLFTAPSGTGKTTHLKLWGKKFGKSVTVIDGDKPFISFENGIPTIWGSPRSGKEGWNTPSSASLCGIAFLQRSETNRIISVSPAEIIEEAFIQFYIPKDKEAAEITFNLIEKLLDSVPIYRLFCNMDIEAAEIAYNTMK